MFIKKFLLLKYKLKYRKIISLSQESTDCGVAALETILKLYGIKTSLEHLRDLSGTNSSGTTVLGMCQAGSFFDFDLQFKYIEFKDLSQITTPSILMVSFVPDTFHYIVVLEKFKDYYVVHDPDIGIILYNQKFLKRVWNSVIIYSNNKSKIQSENSQVKESIRTWIINILSDSKSTIILSVFLTFIVAILNISVYVIFQQIIDKIIPQQDIQLLIPISVVLFFVFFLKSILSLMKDKFNNQLTFDLNVGISNYFSNIFFKLPKTFFIRRKNGEIVARFNDTLKVQDSIFYFINESVKNIFIIIISLSIIFYFSVHIGLFIIALIPILFLISLYFGEKIKTQQQFLFVSNAIKSGSLFNIIQGLDYIKIANKENYFSEMYGKHFKTHQKDSYSLQNYKSILNFNLELVSGIFSIVILIYGSFLVFNNHLQLGQLIAIFFIFLSLILPIVSLPFIFIQYSSMTLSINRVNELKYLISDNRQDVEISNFDYLIFDNVTFNYPGNKPIITHMSFKIKANEFVCFIGESGIGKTTLINLLIGFFNPTSGQIKINNNLSSNIDRKKWINKIGLVEQNVPIFNGSIAFNISLDNDCEEEMIINFCKNNGFHNLISSLPNSYNTMLGEMGTSLSNGQRQLIGIARALFKNPEILILDEPSSALDYVNEEIILEILKKIQGQITIILITHRFNLTYMSDTIHIIDNGHIKVSGTHNELLSCDNFYSRYYNLTVGNVEN